MSTLLTLGVLALTLVLIFWRPKGLHEAWAAVIGAALILLLKLETANQAIQTILQGGDVLLFLLGLMLFSALLDVAGFFEWAAIHATLMAKGDKKLLFRNVFVLGSIVTFILSLDTTAIILTPVVLAFVRRLKLPGLPFVVACAFIPNSASLLLPVSNLTNLLFQSRFRWPFDWFVLRMALPQAAALVATYAVFLLLYRRELFQQREKSPEQKNTPLPEPKNAITDGPYFVGAVIVLLAILVGYFVGPRFGLEEYEVALSGCVLLLVWAMIRRAALREALPVSKADPERNGSIQRTHSLLLAKLISDVSWSLFPFVCGLFVIVRAVEHLPWLSNLSAGLLHFGGQPLNQDFATSFSAAVGSNLLNNVPMALLGESVLTRAHAGTAAQLGTLIGCNLGPNLTLFGSLATMLVVSTARKKGEDIAARDLFRAGAVATPIALVCSSAALAVVLTLLR